MDNHQTWTRETRARRNRKQLTREEAILWKYLKASGIGVPFRKQHGVGPYLVDFACLKPKLVVEADGGQHFDSEYDRRRDRYLKGRGFVVLRFWNEDVWERIDWVLDQIRRVLLSLDPELSLPLD